MFRESGRRGVRTSGDAIPRLLQTAIEAGAWRNPAPGAVGPILSTVRDLPAVELFESVEAMRRVGRQLDEAGWVDDPEFCMVRTRDELEPPGDARLVFDEALFVGGSTVAGDDVLIAVEVGAEKDPPVLVFDWDRAIPERWVPACASW